MLSGHISSNHLIHKIKYTVSERMFKPVQFKQIHLQTTTKSPKLQDAKLG